MLATFYSQKDSWYSFLLEAESTQRPIVRLEGLGQLKNPTTPAGIKPMTWENTLMNVLSSSKRSLWILFHLNVISFRVISEISDYLWAFQTASLICCSAATTLYVKISILFEF
jgi:hypothetical protein